MKAPFCCLYSTSVFFVNEARRDSSVCFKFFSSPADRSVWAIMCHGMPLAFSWSAWPPAVSLTITDRSSSGDRSLVKSPSLLHSLQHRRQCAGIEIKELAHCFDA